jgi:hypothetical protein
VACLLNCGTQDDIPFTVAAMNFDTPSRFKFPPLFSLASNKVSKYGGHDLLVQSRTRHQGHEC